jgi:hypothetical protein
VRHDPPRIVWAGCVWTSETGVQMPNYAAIMERELAAVNAETVRLYLLVLRALGAREAAVMDGAGERAAMVTVTPPKVGLFDDEEDG